MRDLLKNFQLSMLDISPLHKIPDFSKLLESLRRRKRVVMLNGVPSTEENEFVLLALFINSPPTSLLERCIVSI